MVNISATIASSFKTCPKLYTTDQESRSVDLLPPDDVTAVGKSDLKEREARVSHPSVYLYYCLIFIYTTHRVHFTIFLTGKNCYKLFRRHLYLLDLGKKNCNIPPLHVDSLPSLGKKKYNIPLHVDGFQSAYVFFILQRDQKVVQHSPR